MDEDSGICGVDEYGYYGRNGYVDCSDQIYGAGFTMPATMHHSFNEINNNKIKARILRMWIAKQVGTEYVLSLDLVLIDQKKNLHHATIDNYLMYNYVPMLKEDEVCLISNYRIEKVGEKESHRPVSNDKKMVFTHYTQVRKAAGNTSDFPQHKFEFVDFEDIPSRYKGNVLVDVIGKLIQPITQKRPKDKKITELMIEDMSGRKMRICLWEEMADQLDINAIGRSKKPQVIVATSTEVKYFQGTPYLSSTQATKVYVNLDIPEVEAYKKMPATSENAFSAEKRITIRQLVGLLQDVSNENKEFTCEATIKGLVPYKDWYYKGCIRCKSKSCKPEKCPRSDGKTKPIFRLELEVGDQTGRTTFVAFSPQAEELLDYPDITEQIQIYNSLIEEEKHDFIEKRFPQLCGKKYVFTLQITGFILRRKLESFKIVRMQRSDARRDAKHCLTNVKKELGDEDSDHDGVTSDDEEPAERGDKSKRLCQRY